MSIHIEEKEFESAFLAEVGNSHGQYSHTIGQVLEATWGFDALLFLQRRHPVWSHSEMIRWRRGRLMREISGLRDVRANLFVQFKRSDRRTRKMSKPYKYFGAAYYEYRINRTQQELLDGLARKTTYATAIYAAPVFHRRKDLTNFRRSGAVISNSNIVQATRLNRHSRYTFISSNKGMAFSEPESIEAENLKVIVDRLRQQNEKKTFAKNLSELSASISEVCEERNLHVYLEETSGILLGATEEYAYFDGKEVSRDLTKVIIFSEMTNAHWMIL